MTGARSRAAAFGRRLEQLAQMSREAGIDPVFVTQPALYGEGTDPRTGADLAGLSVGGVDGRTAWRRLEIYNDQIRAVARERRHLLVDLARRFPKDSQFFYDDIHFNAADFRVVADIVGDALCAYLEGRQSAFRVSRCPQTSAGSAALTPGGVRGPRS